MNTSIRRAGATALAAAALGLTTARAEPLPTAPAPEIATAAHTARPAAVALGIMTIVLAAAMLRWRARWNG